MWGGLSTFDGHAVRAEFIVGEILRAFATFPTKYAVLSLRMSAIGRGQSARNLDARLLKRCFHQIQLAFLQGVGLSGNSPASQKNLAALSPKVTARPEPDQHPENCWWQRALQILLSIRLMASQKTTRIAYEITDGRVDRPVSLSLDATNPIS
jgi:hypothetical protein